MVERHDNVETLRHDRCRNCGKKVLWMGTSTGKWYCLDEQEYLFRKNQDGDAFVYTDMGHLVRCVLLNEEDCRAGKEKFHGRGRTPHICAIV